VSQERLTVWKWLLGFTVLSIVVCGVGGYFLATSPQVKTQLQQFMPGGKPTEVRIEPAGLGELSRTISAPGQIEAKTSVKISAQVSARIIALPMKVNDSVRAGDVLVRLDAVDLQAQLDASRATLVGEQARLEGSQVTLQRARQDLARVRTLHASGDRTKSELEQAETEVARAETSEAAAKSAIRVAEAQIARAQKDLENTIIKSPMDGIITRLDAEVGEVVVIGTLNNAASVIMEIQDLSSMLLRARVDETNIVPVKDGLPAKVFINAYGEREFKARVGLVELQRRVDRDNTGYFEVELPIELPPGEVLRAGLTANTEIVVETMRDVLVVPSQAVVDRKIDELPKSVTEGNANVPRNNTFARVVFRAEPIPGKTTPDGKPLFKVVATPVQVGSSDLTRTVVLAGLKAGDTIVTGPFKSLIGLRADEEVVEEKAGVKPDAPAKQGPPPPPGAQRSRPALDAPRTQEAA
jgi:HlyD family secretion protein